MFRWSLLGFSLGTLSLFLPLCNTQKSLALSCSATLQAFEHIHAPPSKPPSLQAEQSQLSQPSLTGEMLQTLHHFCVPSLEGKSPAAPSLFYWGVQNRTQHSRCGLIWAEQRKDHLRMPFLHLLTQPRMQLVPWAFSGEMLSSCSSLDGARDCSSPGADFVLLSVAPAGLWRKEKLHTWTKVHTAFTDTIIFYFQIQAGVPKRRVQAFLSFPPWQGIPQPH